MERRALALLAILGTVGAALYAARAAASTGGGTADNQGFATGEWDFLPSPSDPFYNTGSPDTGDSGAGTLDMGNTPDTTSTPEARVSAQSAFLDTIGQFESGGDYTILFGGGHFSDFSHHPNVPVPFHNPLKAGSGNNDVSTAAGKYQINFPTYRQYAPALGITDFSPASQDAIALSIAASTGALNALAMGDTATAFQLASKKWASLPGSTAQQGARSMTTALATFNEYMSA